MPDIPYMQIGLGVLAAAAALLLVSAFRIRRHREQLRKLGQRYSLGVLEGELPSHVLALTRRYGGIDRKSKLTDTLVGSDDDGTFYLSLRECGRHKHQILFFRIATGAQLDGFHVVPEPTSSADSTNEWPLTLAWTAPRRQWMDETSLSMAARLLYHVAKLGDGEKAALLGVEVHDRLVHIHSVRPLRGADLERFFADAIRLRQLIVRSLRKAKGIGGKTANGSPQQMSDEKVLARS